MRELLRRERPQLIGTQEGLYQQLRDIQADLPDRYDSIGQGRDGVESRRADILTFSKRGQFPSDHLPVQADLVIR